MPESKPLPQALWPFGGRAAVLTSVLSFLVLVIAVAAMQDHGWMGSIQMSLGTLALVAGIAAIPLILRLIDTVARNGGSIAVPGGFSVSIAAAREVASTRVEGTRIASNLGGVRGANIADSGGTAVLDALSPSAGSDVAIVDLGDGDQWWRTRLLLLCAGAHRLGTPQVIVFTATIAGRRGQFVGWGFPREILRQLLLDPELARAHRRASASAARVALGLPGAMPNQVAMPWPNATMNVGDDPSMEPERLLMLELNPLEQPQGERLSRNQISASGLRADLEAVLRTASVDTSASDEAWISHVLCSTEPYVAVTERGEYRSLVSHHRAVNALLASVIAPGIDCATAMAPCHCPPSPAASQPRATSASAPV